MATNAAITEAVRMPEKQVVTRSFCELYNVS